LLKQIHIGLAIVSISGFVLRWTWLMRGSSLKRHRWKRTLPHIVDTVFLATGILLAISIQQYPWTAPWLAAKLCGLLGYILLGMAAMNMKSSGLRVAAFLGAVVTFAWIISVARLKSPWGLLQLPHLIAGFQ